MLRLSQEKIFFYFSLIFKLTYRGLPSYDYKYNMNGWSQVIYTGRI